MRFLASFNFKCQTQRVLALCDFWDLEKVALAKMALGKFLPNDHSNKIALDKKV